MKAKHIACPPWVSPWLVPTGKSKMVQKIIKKLNKQRKKQGFKKFKIIDVRLADVPADYLRR